MLIRYLIIDDEPSSQRIIKNFMQEYEQFMLIGTCKNAVEAIKAMNTENIDLLFLDINMPELTGLEMLKSIKNPPLTVITTAYRDYAFESYELDVIDYLHKPFSKDRFDKSVQKVIHYLQKDATKTNQSTKDYFFIKTDKKQIRLNFSEVLYIESLGDYCKLHTENGSYITHNTLKNLESSLSEDFSRVHKSYIVNISKIDYIEGNYIKIRNDEVPIGQSFRQNIQQMIMKKS
jgi:DNA-binding LytR/AlgR family response regulator